MSKSKEPLSETPLQRELKLLRERIEQLLDLVLNRVFSLKPESARRRRWYLIFLFFFCGFVISTIDERYSIGLWVLHIQDIFMYLFIPSYADSYTGNPFIKAFEFGVNAFLNLNTFQYFPILLIAFFTARQLAARYLSDIFEIDGQSIALKFITQVSLTGSNDTIRIKNGDIAPDDIMSPIYKIGGPGKVIVDIDSVALFEKPNGTPNIIGPTANQPQGKAILDGFERLRNVIDLRDQHSDPFSVSSRSRDGIKISAVDVKIIYSISRDDKKMSDGLPYPFSYDAVKKLVYDDTAIVIDRNKLSISPSSPRLVWLPSALGLIKSELGRIMGRYELAKYLASFGEPEHKQAEKREGEIAKLAKMNLPTREKKPAPRPVPAPPEFKPRHEITKVFYEYKIESEFKKKSQDRGIDIPWVGVGTWNTPIEIITEQHIKAWLLSKENSNLGNNDALKNLYNKTIQQKMETLIQDVPILAYQKAIARNDHNHNNAVRMLLVEYRQQLRNAAEFLQAKGEVVPDVIIRAIEHIYKILGYDNWHWIGK